MIQIIVQAQKASCRKSSGEKITTGMVGKQVSFDFSADWDGLVKTAVFEGSGVTKDVTLSGDTAVIPHECLTVPGGMLRVGVYGTDGTIQTPTVYTDIGQIEQGADPSGDTSADPTLPIWAQLQAMMGDLGNLTTTAKNNLVEAINEAAKSGGTADDVKMQVAGGYIQYSTDGGKSWNNLIAMSELIGPTGPAGPAGPAGPSGADGKDGAPGYTPVKGTDYFTEEDKQEIAEAAAGMVSISVDSTLTKKGQAADAKATGDAIHSLSEEKVSLPKDTEGNIIPGTVGWYAVSDGAGGITWVESAPSGGATTHGIIWNLTNVTSSNNAASVPDGASLVAVLTPADGYALGDVTITMGGEVVTGAWNAETATVTIPSVTGDVIISCAGVAEGTGEVVDTTAVIEVQGKGINNAGRVYANENWGYTKFYEVNDTSITMLGTNTEGVGGPTSNAIMTIFLDTDDGTTPFTITGYANPLGTLNLGKEATYTVKAGTVGLRSTILLAEIDNYYCYETNTGKVIYAGSNTPYYGLTNVNNASATVETSSVDDDIAQDYSVAATSILGEEVAENTNSAYGLDSDFAAAIDSARTAWMTEYGSDYRKIPVIITTDQHAHKKSGIFNMLGAVLNMYDVSKIMNLGDTISVEWYDDDTDYPLRTNATLDAWLESIKAIPFSKRLDVYGNHDTWYGNYADDGNTVGTRYPSSQAHLYQYFRNIYARRINNNGWFVVHDDMFNVKYVVVSGFEYNGGVAFRIGTKQMQFIIDEFSKDDGYDIVVVSHVPLYYQDSTNVWPTGMESSSPDSTAIMRVAAIDTDALFNARKNKTSGTVTDSDGVTHTFDFSSCTTDILCGLHGHTHIDAYNYVGGSDNGLVNATFDWFGSYAIHFVLIDRINRQLNVWKTDRSYEVMNYQVPFDKPVE